MANKQPYRTDLVRLIIVGAVVVVLTVLWWTFVRLDERQAESFLHQFPVAVSGLIFVGIYVGLTTCIWFGLGNFLRIAAVMVYGPHLSTLLLWAGEMFNLLIMFNLSRKLGRRYVAGKLKGNLQRLDEATRDLSFGWLFFLRFFPVVPFRFLDLGLGLTQIPLRRYFLIAALASPIRIFWIQFFLSKGIQNIRDPFVLADYLTSDPVILWANVLYIGGTLVLITVLAGRMARRRKRKVVA